MDQQKTTSQQKLTTDELKKIKGGFREVPGQISGSLSTRWDEITIRLQDDRHTFGMGSRPQSSQPLSGTRGKN